MTPPPAAPYQGVRVVVLGAGGFIGRWVVRLLGAQQADVQPVTRQTIDLAVPGAVAGLIRTIRPAIVFNLAGYGVNPAERDETLAARLNADLPPAIAEAMAPHGLADWQGMQVVHAGSALEYGTAAGDLHERTPGTPTTLYGRTKLDGTLRLYDAARRTGVRAATGRLFTVYGPGERDGRLLPTLRAAAASQGPIPLTSGLQRRDFTYVADAADGLLRLGALRSADAETVNVATGTLATVRTFVETAATILGIGAERLAFGAIATRAEEMHHDAVNTGRLRTLTGWSPATSLRDGIAHTIGFREQP